jgi:hypothetical protein
LVSQPTGVVEDDFSSVGWLGRYFIEKLPLCLLGISPHSIVCGGSLDSYLPLLDVMELEVASHVVVEHR